MLWSAVFLYFLIGVGSLLWGWFIAWLMREIGEKVAQKCTPKGRYTGYGVTVFLWLSRAEQGFIPAYAELSSAPAQKQRKPQNDKYRQERYR